MIYNKIPELLNLMPRELWLIVECNLRRFKFMDTVRWLPLNLQFPKWRPQQYPRNIGVLRTDNDTWKFTVTRLYIHIEFEVDGIIEQNEFGTTMKGKTTTFIQIKLPPHPDYDPNIFFDWYYLYRLIIGMNLLGLSIETI